LTSIAVVFGKKYSRVTQVVGLVLVGPCDEYVPGIVDRHTLRFGRVFYRLLLQPEDFTLIV
jgi:hypothetical protein